MKTSTDQPSTLHKRAQGEQLEGIAALYLKEQGLVLLEQNYSCKMGELDLIMQDQKTLVFIEVRHRKNDHFGHPVETVSYHKQQKLRKAAQHYALIRNISSHQAMRFDVVGLLGQVPNLQYEWIQNAF